MRRTVDTLIIGQGLAGSILAWTLQQRGASVRVVDDGHHSAASTAAAGLINPLAGMRFGYHAHCREWLPSAEAFYRALSDRLGGPFLHSIDMLRLFRSGQQIRFWQRRAGDASARPLLGDRFERISDTGERLQAPFGGFVQHHTGYVEVNRLLETLRERLRRDGHYEQTDIAYAELRPHADRVQWRDVSARQLIFCEGYRAQANPWFGWLPFQPDKGEILTLEAPKRLCRRIVNGAHWLIPLVDGRYRFGSTHDHRRLDQTPTEAARTELLLGLQHLLGFDPGCRVVGHRAGVRPATRDRLPLIGRHPNEPGLVLFNGFGARGSLTIPWYAARLADHLLEGAPLPAEADLRRYA